MNTQIKITHNGETYILEYDRFTIKLLEKSGFNYDEFLEKPMTNIELAFTAAFIKNHPNTKQSVDWWQPGICTRIYHESKDKAKLVAVITKMINDFYDSLLADPEDDSGNTTWEIVDLTPSKKEKNQE